MVFKFLKAFSHNFILFVSVFHKFIALASAKFCDNQEQKVPKSVPKFSVSSHFRFESDPINQGA